MKERDAILKLARSVEMVAGDHRWKTYSANADLAQALAREVLAAFDKPEGEQIDGEPDSEAETRAALEESVQRGSGQESPCAGSPSPTKVLSEEEWQRVADMLRDAHSSTTGSSGAMFQLREHDQELRRQLAEAHEHIAAIEKARIDERRRRADSRDRWMLAHDREVERANTAEKERDEATQRLAEARSKVEMFERARAHGSAAVCMAEAYQARDEALARVKELENNTSVLMQDVVAPLRERAEAAEARVADAWAVANAKDKKVLSAQAEAAAERLARQAAEARVAELEREHELVRVMGDGAMATANEANGYRVKAEKRAEAAEAQLAEAKRLLGWASPLVPDGLSSQIDAFLAAKGFV